MDEINHIFCRDKCGNKEAVRQALTKSGQGYVDGIKALFPSIERLYTTIYSDDWISWSEKNSVYRHIMGGNSAFVCCKKCDGEILGECIQLGSDKFVHRECLNVMKVFYFSKSLQRNKVEAENFSKCTLKHIHSSTLKQLVSNY